jgi:guanylate kinase
MARGIPLVISAPSGAGKSTLVQGLRERLPGIGFSVSHTTRRPRAGEQEGVAYHFVERTAFEAMARRGGFLEWAEVHGNLYGTSIEALEPRLAAGEDVVLDIDVQGAAQIRKRLPEAVSIFILPPSQDALRRRLEGRGLDAADVVERRLANAAVELAQANRYDYLIVNDHVAQATEELCCVVRAERCRTSRRAELLRELLPPHET